MNLAGHTSMAFSWIGLAVIGLSAGRSIRFLDRGALALMYSVVGWTGMLGGAAALQFGERWSLELMPIPVALGVAGAAALVVAPLAGDHEEVVPFAYASSAVVAVVLGAAAIWMARSADATPWSRGAVLFGAHWAVLAASVSSALTGALVASKWCYRATMGAWSGASPLRGYARDAATRAVVLLWLAWPAGALLHGQFLGVTGVGSRSEWFAVGVTLLATGSLLLGWDLRDDTVARIRSIVAPFAVATVIVAGLWVSFGFGSPFALSLGS